MASPIVVARTTYVSSTSNATSWTPLSSVAVARGEMLVFIASADGNPTLSTSSTGWQQLDQASESGNAVTGAIFVRYPDDNDSATTTLAINSTASEQYSGILYRLRGCDSIDFGTAAQGSSANSNPPSNTLPVSARDILAIATRHGDSTTVATVAPSGYTNLESRAAGGANGASTNSAELALSATATEDPGTFTSGNEQWVSYTLLLYQSDAPALAVAIANRNNTAVTYRGGGVYEIEKTAGAVDTYDASATSSASIAGDFVLRLRNLAGSRQFIGGVNSDPTTNDSFNSIDFGALYFVGSNIWGCYENGTGVVTGLTETAKYFWIWRTGTTLGYGRGDDLATAQASPDRTTTSSATLYFDSSIDRLNDRFEALLYEIPTGALSASGSSDFPGTGTTVTIASGALSASGTSDFPGTGASNTLASGAISATGTGDASLGASALAGAALSGQGAAGASPAGNAFTSADLAASSSSSSAATGEAVAEGAMDAAGTGTTAIEGSTGESAVEGDLVSSTVGSLSGVGQAIAEGAFSASGNGAVAATGVATAASALSGSGTAANDNEATVAATGALATASTGVLEGEGQHTAEANLSATGSSGLASAGQAIVAGDFAGSAAGDFAGASDDAATIVSAALTASGAGSAGQAGAGVGASSMSAAGTGAANDQGRLVAVSAMSVSTLGDMAQGGAALAAVSLGTSGSGTLALPSATVRAGTIIAGGFGLLTGAGEKVAGGALVVTATAALTFRITVSPTPPSRRIAGSLGNRRATGPAPGPRRASGNLQPRRASG